MRPLKPAELLEAWERGRGASPVDRALMLLAHACAERSWDGLAALPIGERDAWLLTLREWTFGPSMSSVAACPACGARVELSFTVGDVRAAAGSAEVGAARVNGIPPGRSGPADATVIVRADAAPVLAMDGPDDGEPSGGADLANIVDPVGSVNDLHRLSVGGYEVAFRLPSSADLAGLGDEGDARLGLLRRCVREVRRKGRRRAVNQLPAAVLDAVAERMSEADPRADVRTALTCPDCGHGWQVVFDIVTWFWAELEDWAYRTLRDVHALASAYGWREADVLALSPWRRQCYLRMVDR